MDLIHIFDPGTSTKRPEVLKKFLELTPAFYACPIQGTKSLTGREVEGHLVMCPLLPDQILDHDPRFVIEKVCDAARVAEKLGIKLLGLAAYISLVGKRGSLVAKRVSVPVTTGTAYTIATAYDAALYAAERVGIQLRTCSAAIIGATGTIGGACSVMLSAQVSQLILVARNKQRLADLAISLKCDVEILKTTDDPNEAVRGADVVICCTNSPTALIGVDSLKPGSVVCDVSQPHNISSEVVEQRKDVLVIDGGVVKPPGDVNFNFNFGLAPGLAFACMAETMILALEQRYECFSLGGNISLAKIREIAALGRKHGFQIANLRSFDQEVTEEQIERVREARLRHSAGAFQ